MFITALAKRLPSSLVVTGLSSELDLRVLDSQKCLEPDAAEAASAQLHFQPCHANLCYLLLLKPFLYLDFSTLKATNLTLFR